MAFTANICDLERIKGGQDTLRGDGSAEGRKDASSRSKRGNDSEARKKGKQPERADYCDRVGAGVLFIASRETVKDAMDEERQKLVDICGVDSSDSRSSQSITLTLQNLSAERSKITVILLIIDRSR